MRAQQARRRSFTYGYTLVELMVVVAITGVLAALAIPAFSSYLQKSRTSEAVEFLGVIKLRQAAYRSEFGTYLKYNNQATLAGAPWVPAGTMQNAVVADFPNDNPFFNQLGAYPDGPVRFQYKWAAGLPTEAPEVVGLVAPNLDHWFVAQAQTDLDGDGIPITFEVTSHSRGVWVGIAGTDEPKGWD